jgi:hypothetical protein
MGWPNLNVFQKCEWFLVGHSLYLLNESSRKSHRYNCICSNVTENTPQKICIFGSGVTFLHSDYDHGVINPDKI